MSEAPDDPVDKQGRPPRGLDTARHAAAQEAARNAEVMRNTYIPASLATALGTQLFDGSACQVFLERFVADAGGTRDPIERVLVEQLAIAHLRLANLHSQAGQAKSLEAVKIYTGAAARLLGEVRRLALTLRDYRERLPSGKKSRISQAS